MTEIEPKPAITTVKDLLLQNPDGLREVVRAVMQEVLESEMTEAIGASKSERTPDRIGYRSGYYGRTLITRVGKLELRVPQESYAGIWVTGSDQAAWLTGISMTSTPFWNLTPSTSLGNWF